MYAVGGDDSFQNRGVPQRGLPVRVGDLPKLVSLDQTTRIVHAVRRLSQHAPEHIDTSDPELQKDTVRLAGFILGQAGTRDGLMAVQDVMSADKTSFKPVAHQAIKCALSKHAVQAITEPAHVSIVVAMFKEQNRMLPKSEHPNGENFLINKSNQLRWLFDGSRVSFDITYVDDGCPERSGEKAQEIIDRQGIPNSRVLNLQAAIDQSHPITAGLKNATTDSQKGAAIQYGMWEALRLLPPHRHFVAFTDSDLSYDLRMMGVLLEPLMNGGHQCAIGSRYLKDSAQDSPAQDGMTGPRIQAFVAFRARIRNILLPNLDALTDTNAGFKMFDSQFLALLLAKPMDPKFPFDQELLLRVLLRNPNALVQVPVFSADSVAEATSRGGDVHLQGLKGLARIYKRNRIELKPTDEADKIANFLENLDLPTYQRMTQAFDLERLRDRTTPFGYETLLELSRFEMPFFA